jgi:CheY-like chemotaxis protein
MAQGNRRELHGIHVLVIDDVEHARQAFRAVLEFWGALVTALTAAEALGAALRADVIVCDLETAEAAGSGFLERLRRLHTRGARPVPMIALMPAEVATAGTARAPGFQRHLGKPVSGEELRTAVGELARPSP